VKLGEDARPGVGENRGVKEKGVLERYKSYNFTKDLGENTTKDLGENTWLDFLESYFNETQRKSRIEEDEKDGRTVKLSSDAVAAARGIFNHSGLLSRLSDDPKPSPRVGADCSCPSIKNYPQELEEKGTEQAQRKAKRNVQAVSITEGAAKAF
jgi:hypothetical protein